MARRQVVTFDMDGTLVDFRSAMRTGLETALGVIRSSVGTDSGLTVDVLEAHREQVATTASPFESMEEIRRAAFELSLQSIDVDDDDFVDRVTAAYLETRFSTLVTFDDVVPTLQRLRSSSRLGVASNGNSYPRHAGLDGYFEFTVFAHDHGLRKPDPRFFERVLETAGCEPDDVVHVGDSADEDVAAANEVGIRAVWLNRDRRKRPRGVRPWAELTSLRELPVLLESRV